MIINEQTRNSLLAFQGTLYVNILPVCFVAILVLILSLILMYALSIDTRRVFFFYIEKLEKLEFAAGSAGSP